MAAHDLARVSQAAFRVLTGMALLLFPTRWVGAQPAPLGPVIGIEEPSSENSRTPFELHVTGVLNPAWERHAETQAEAEGKTAAETSIGVEQTHAKQGIADVTAFRRDGEPDDSRAIDRAQLSLPDTGGIVFFPAGTYAIKGVVLKRSNVTFRGAGMTKSVLQRSTSGDGNWLVQSSGVYPIQNIAFEDLGFDGKGPGLTGAALLVNGSHVSGTLRISRCRFWNMRSMAVSIANMTGDAEKTVEDSVFATAGLAMGLGLRVENSSKITVRNNKFLWLSDGILNYNGVTKETVENNEFFMGWWQIKELVGNEGKSVSYLSNSLTDSSIDFGTYLSAKAKDYEDGQVWHNIRVMPVKQRGVASVSGVTLNDADADFKTKKVRRGEIIRFANSDTFGIIAEVTSPTSLKVYEWLNRSDYQPARSSPGGSYTLYGIIIGSVWAPSGTKQNPAVDGHTLKTVPQKWFDLDGNQVTPPKETRYELLIRRPNYQFHSDPGPDKDNGLRDITVRNNTFRFGWSDQISIFGKGTGHMITENTIEDGEDMGITFHGDKGVVSNNTIRHQGAGGIWTDAHETLFEGNKVYDSQWTNSAGPCLGLGDIIVNAGQRNTLRRNYTAFTGQSLGYHGIVVKGASGLNTENNILDSNVGVNHRHSDIYLLKDQGGQVLGTSVLNNGGKIVDNSTSTNCP